MSEPLRCVAFGFAAAANATVPVPLPLAPLVTVSHDVLLLTPVHAQPANVVTVVEPVPPAATTDWLVGLIEYVHAAPACVTVRVCPPIVSVPLRCVVLALAAALNPRTRRRCRSRHSSRSATTCCC